MTTTTARQSVRAAGFWLRWSVAPRYRHRVVTGLGLAALAAAAGMAVFGLPPVDLHGRLHHVGIMDPLCGGTRAAAYTARGEWALAWRYNPLGILAALAATAAVLRAVVGLLTRRWVTVAWTPRRVRTVAVTATVLLVALTVRRQMRADLLIARHVDRAAGACLPATDPAWPSR